jgi:hypothetical protein
MRAHRQDGRICMSTDRNDHANTDRVGDPFDRLARELAELDYAASEPVDGITTYAYTGDGGILASIDHGSYLEGVTAGQHGGDLAQGAAQPRVALTGGGGLGLAGGLVGAGREPGPGRQMCGGREDAHVHAEFGDEFLGAGDTDADDLIELGT